MPESTSPHQVRVQLKQRSYDIVIGAHLIANAHMYLTEWSAARGGSSQSPSAFIITDHNVANYAQEVQSRLTAAGWRSTSFEMPPGEQSKQLNTISQAWDALVEFKADRKTIVIAVGGGVVGDAAGFVAATFARGVPFVQIPTTLLADVDSSVGGKVGINHPQAKNLIGAFHQPIGVLIDTETLTTLPEREYRAGLAEVVKYGVILDEPFFRQLEESIDAIHARKATVLRSIIARSCELKAHVVEQDEYETTGLRAILNYGHTYCHAFEALTGYGELLHGEAVSIGMVYAARLAEKMGRVDGAFCTRQAELLQSLQLPLNLPHPGQLTVEDVLDRMQLDKKTVGGQLRFILPTRIGHVELVDAVPEALVRETLLDGGLSG